MWAINPDRPMRHQALFGDRVVRCYCERPVNLDAMIRETVARFPDRPAYRDGERTLSYREFDTRLNGVAHRLQRDGITAGERVGVLCANSIEFICAIFGAVRFGAVAVPIGTRQQKAEIEYIAQDCGMAALVFDRDLADRLPEATSMPELRRRYAVGGAVAGATSFDELMRPVVAAPPCDIAGEDLAFIMYTSGTTGRPKGAMLAHVNFVHSAMHFETCVGHGPQTRALLAIPGSHISGLGAVVVTMLRVGGLTVLMREFKTTACLELLARERITFTVFVPTMYKLLLLDPAFDSYRLEQHWKVGLFGGAIMPPAVVDELARKLPGLELVNGYGATETCSPTTVTRPGDAVAHPEGIGHVVPCGDVRIMADDGTEAPTDSPGELWIGGPMVAKGYWNKPEISRASFVGGYWRSGDIGATDGEGRIRILDRMKDMINRAGYKIYSAEVENALSVHPGVVESVVVPRPDEIFGERVQAFVRVLPGVTETELTQFLRERLADYKVPEFMVLTLDPLPRNNNGKLMKAMLKDQARQDADSQAAKTAGVPDRGPRGTADRQ